MAHEAFHVPTSVGVALITAAVATAMQFPMIQAHLSDQYDALNPYPGVAPNEIVEHHFTSTQARFLLYTQLREHARGASLTTHPGAGLSTEQLLGLARLSTVDTGDHDPEVRDPTARSILQAVVAEGEDRRVGAYLIAVGATPSDLVTVTIDGRLAFVDQTLLGADSPVAGDG